MEFENLRVTPGATPEWNRDEALSCLGGDAELLDELLLIFIGEWPDIRRRLRNAWEQRDAKALAAVGHSLKGQLPCLGCGEAGALAGKIEQAARAGDFEGAHPDVARLDHGTELLVTSWRKAAKHDEVAHCR